MDRFARAIAFGLVLAATALYAGCSSSPSSFLAGPEPAAADAPAKVANEDPAARPIAVAWTSARAQRCGFYFDPGKLKASYLAYEAKQSGPDLAAKAAKSYDTTFKTIHDRVASDPDYCSDRKSAEIKADLTRHLAGDFRPNFPKPKVVESCWLYCGDGSSEEWSGDKYWQEQAKRQGGSAY
jgi:hypothetical protein